MTTLQKISFVTALCSCFSLQTTSAQQLWGTTIEGGGNNLGIIYTIKPDGTNLTVQKEFLYTTTVKDGFPENTTMFQASNGKLYGTTEGGSNRHGALFEYNLSTSAYTKLHDFGVTSADGASVPGAVVQAGNGKLYGMTFAGGVNGVGTIYEYDPAGNTYAKKYDFNTTKGSYPYGSLCVASNGKLYGMTGNGGVNSSGVIFEFDPVSATVTKKFDFAGTGPGAQPFGDLVQSTDGKFYGMTSYDDGNPGLGTLFMFDPATGTASVKFQFDDTGGGTPFGSLAATGGKLYGMTSGGGTNGLGTVFEFNPATSVFTKKVDFGGATNGSSPNGSLTVGTNGKLYGVTTRGGVNDKGVLFEFDPLTGALTKKIDFSGTANGANPYYGAMTQATNGKLYGTTGAGGTNNTGIIFEYDPGVSTLTKKLDFGSAADGSAPPGELTFAPNGKLYGVTENGGASNAGLVFEVDPVTSVFTRKASFESETTGSVPIGRMIVATNGKLYGLAYAGGATGAGTIYEFDPATSILTKKMDFDTPTSGSTPFGGLTQAPNGKMYGLASFGGTQSQGTLFEFDPASGAFSKKANLSSATGTSPQGTFVLAPNNKLYAATRGGGTNSSGTIIEYDPATAVLTKKFDFGPAPAPTNVRGSFVLAGNGKLYAMSGGGGTNGQGAIFEYDPGTTTISKKYDFPSSANPFIVMGSMVKSSNDKLYGTTNQGGTNNMGTLFEFDPATSTFTNKIDFNGTNGAQPWRGALTFVPLSTVATGAIVTGDIVPGSDPRIVIHPNPASANLRVSMENIPGKKTIAIYSMTGQRMTGTETSENEILLDVSAHAPGVYLVQTLTEKTSFVERFVKH